MWDEQVSRAEMHRCTDTQSDTTIPSSQFQCVVRIVRRYSRIASHATIQSPAEGAIYHHAERKQIERAQVLVLARGHDGRGGAAPHDVGQDDAHAGGYDASEQGGVCVCHSCSKLFRIQSYAKQTV